MKNIFQMYQYRSIQDLNTLILRNLPKLPRDIDIVVGVPRSGMLVANLIALYLDLPFTDLDSFIDGRTYRTGRRGALHGSKTGHMVKVLIVDDSIGSGHEMISIKKQLQNSKKDNHEYVFLAAYSMPDSHHHADYVFEILPAHCFQWNIMNHPRVERSIVELDSLLWAPSRTEHESRQASLNLFDLTAAIRPSREIGTLITRYTEDERAKVYEWLEINHIKYRQLVMNKATASSSVAYNRFKSHMIRESSSTLFFEGSNDSASYISTLAGRPVFSTQTMEMHYPSKLARGRYFAWRLPAKARKLMLQIFNNKKS